MKHIMKLLIERTHEWVPVEMISGGPIRLWQYEWRNNKYVLSQDMSEDIGKKIINNINIFLDAEMINEDTQIYRKVMQYKGRS